MRLDFLVTKEGQATLGQIGAIIHLSGNLGIKQYQLACEWVQFNHTKEEADQYIGKLINQLLTINNGNNNNQEKETDPL